MHFFGVFMQVHFEAKRYGLRGLNDEEMPKLRESLALRWPTLIPLVLLISILISGRTPYLAAFVGITSCAIVGLITPTKGIRPISWVLLAVLHGLLMLLAFGGFDEDIKMAIFVGGAVLTFAGTRLGRITGRIRYALSLIHI